MLISFMRHLKRKTFLHTGFEGKIHDLCPHGKKKKADEGILLTIINLENTLNAKLTPSLKLRYFQ